jgi:hypothetical protein
MKKYNQWGACALIFLFASTIYVDTFVFPAASNRRRLWHPKHFPKSFAACRNQFPILSLLDRRLSEILYDNKTVHIRSRSNQVHPAQYPQGYIQVQCSIPPALLDLSAVQAPRPFKTKTLQPEQVTSWNRALEQINALFDLANYMGDDSLAVSNDLVLTALESFVNRLRISVQEGSIRVEFVENIAGLLSAVEALVCRVNEIHTSPTLSTVESVWWILQQERQNGTMTSVESRRTIHLLKNWTAWSEQLGTPLFGRPPPIQLVMQPFRESAVMSTDLWDFYLSLLRRTPSAQRDYTKSSYKSNDTPSDVPFFELSLFVLKILSRSALEWELCQCQVIKRIVQTSSKSEPNSPDLIMGMLLNYAWNALHASVKAGCVTDSAWLARFIMSTTPDIDETATTEMHMLLFESMFHSYDPGSLLYMERFLWEHQSDAKWGLPFNATTCQMLLSKYAQTAAMNPYYTTASLGRRAERFMYRAYQKLYCKQWHPDLACAVHVLDAYLPITVGGMINASLLLSRVRKADYFVRNFVRQFHLQPRADNEEVGMNSSYRVYERLFDAYYDAVLMSFHNDDEISRINTNRIAQHADELFRFYLIQHRDGRIHSEIPSEAHLHQLIRLFNSCRRTNETVTIDIPQKVSEYRHILQQIALQDTFSIHLKQA